MTTQVYFYSYLLFQQYQLIYTYKQSIYLSTILLLKKRSLKLSQLILTSNFNHCTIARQCSGMLKYIHSLTLLLFICCQVAINSAWIHWQKGNISFPSLFEGADHKFCCSNSFYWPQLLQITRNPFQKNKEVTLQYAPHLILTILHTTMYNSNVISIIYSRDCSTGAILINICTPVRLYIGYCRFNIYSTANLWIGC